MSISRLSAATVASAEPGMLPKLPYDRAALQPGIVHLGLGAFHRAHQAVYTHQALEKAAGSEDASAWGIVGVSLRSAGVRDQLLPQDSLYTVHERSSGKTDTRLVGCLLRCLVAPEDPQAVLELLAGPSVRIVSLTVTEKGYCYLPATRALDVAHPDIVHDLDSANALCPRSAIGFLVHALRLRRERGVPPFTVLPCDNLPENGKTVAGVCRAFAAALDASGELPAWIDACAKFPSTMVDCIVPATKEEDIAAAASSSLGGLRDEAMVVCEPFRQWVIEDTFSAGRPAWEQVGAQLVADVLPFEDAKLRVLNGTHSTLAYAGALCGVDFIWQVMQRESLVSLARALLVNDTLPSLVPPEGVDLHAYARAILGRFENRALEHRTRQIAMDGSQKLPVRLLQTTWDRLGAGAVPLVTPFSVACWMRWVTRTDGEGKAIAVQDPLASRFAQIAEEGAAHASEGRAAFIGGKLLAVSEVFGLEDLVQNTAFVEPVLNHLAKLMEAGDDEAAVYAYVSSFVATLPASEL